MTRKLYALASGKCAAESADSPSNQEILLGGHFYLMVLKVSGWGSPLEFGGFPLLLCTATYGMGVSLKGKVPVLRGEVPSVDYPDECVYNYYNYAGKAGWLFAVYER